LFPFLVNLTLFQTIAAIVWIAMLWYAAPLFERQSTMNVPSRLRWTLFLMTAMPLLLGSAHLLTAWALFCIAVIACCLRIRFAVAITELSPWDGIAAAVTFLAASPYIVRPPTDGDSVGYHLTNAMAWVQAGSFEPTWMSLWWYPGGSEVSISAVIAVGGQWIAGVPSLLAAMMLTTRISGWLYFLNVPRFAATAIAAAFITTTTAAFQTYDQRNDLVLAAWFVESLWALREPGFLSVMPLAVISLIKPDGWAFGLAAIISAWRPIAALALSPTAAWALHVRVLKPSAVFRFSSLTPQYLWSTTIAANVPTSLGVLWSALLGAGVATVSLFVAPLVSLVFGKAAERKIALASLLASLLFLITPMGYAAPGIIQYLATGSSLRYDLPALALGAVCLAPLARRIPAVIAVLAAISTVAGIVQLYLIFENDSITPTAFVAATIVLLLAMVALSPSWRTGAAAAASFVVAAIILYGVGPASVRAASFYADELPRIDGHSTKFFNWFSKHPHAVEAVNIRNGQLLMLAPGKQIVSADAVQCELARRKNLWVVVGSAGENYERARTCGRVLFEDGDVIVAGTP
jgi:hypothetical protein